MRIPPTVLLVITVLTVAAGTLGYRCHAVPGRADPVWLVVVCAEGSVAERAYFVGRNGALLHEGRAGDRPFSAPAAPEA